MNQTTYDRATEVDSSPSLTQVQAQLDSIIIEIK